MPCNIYIRMCPVQNILNPIFWRTSDTRQRTIWNGIYIKCNSLFTIASKSIVVDILKIVMHVLVNLLAFNSVLMEGKLQFWSKSFWNTIIMDNYDSHSFKGLQSNSITVRKNNPYQHKSSLDCRLKIRCR